MRDSYSVTKRAGFVSRLHLAEFCVFPGAVIGRLGAVALVLACLLGVLAPSQLRAQNVTLVPYIVTLAGNGTRGYGGFNQTARVVSPISSSQADPKAQAKILDVYGKLPLSFEINQGQTDPRVKFLSRGGGYTLFLTGNEAVLSLQKKAGVTPPFRGPRTGLKPGASTSVDKPTTDNGARTTNAVLRMRLVGANVKAAVTGAEQLPGKSNYFIGNDPQKWRTNVPNYAKVRFQGVYPGVDLVFYGNQGGRLEYDFVVAPGADPSVVALEVGAEGVRPAKGERRSTLQIAADGDVVVKTDGGEVRFQKPVVYQPTTGDPESQTQNRELLDGRYVLLAGNRVGFEIPNYDKTRPLVIDPVLTYSTYLGGSGNENPYGLGGVAVDASGNAYVTAYTWSTDFPTTGGAYQTTSSTGSAFVTKFNPSGSEHVYSTYFGGNLAITTAIAIDAQGNAYIAGYTWPNGIPTTTGAFQPTGAGNYPNAFIAKLDPTGSSLVYSTYVGGTANTEAFALAVDSTGNAYVAGQTNSTDFPTTPNGADLTCGTAEDCNLSMGYGTLDAFFLELDPTGSKLLYSTYLGGSDVDVARGVALDASGNAYVAGFTFSSDFPTTPGAFQTSGSLAAFVVKVAPSLSGSSSVIYSTLLNGSGDDRGTGIAVVPAGNAYVVGITNSSDFPATPGAFQPTPGGGYDAFVAELNPAGSGLVYSTYLGGSSDEGFEYGTDAIGAIALDASGNAYVTGYTRSGNFPTASPLQPGLGGGGGSCTGSNFIPDGPCPDAYVAKLNSAGSALIFSTYLGGSADDKGIGVAVDGSGNVYAVGTTQSTDFPVMHAFQPSNAGGTDAFVVKLSDLALPATTLSSSSLNFGNLSVGTSSGPEAVTLTNAGDAPLTIAGITITGTNSGDFSEAGCGTSLSAGTSCTISVTFTPKTPTAETATLTVTDDSGGVSGSTQTVSLTGMGVQLTPTFSGLTASQSIQAGTATISLAGKIGVGGYYPSDESVTITIDGVPQSVTVLSDGLFSTKTFPTSTIPASGTPYTITYSYGGDTTLLPASDASTSLTVNAPLPNFTLTITTAIGTGSGTVADGTWGQGQINCTDSAGTLSGTCSGSYVSGTPVTLTATATGPSTFVGWGGDCASSGMNPCSLTVSGPLNVTVNFATQFPPAQLQFNAGTNVSTMATFCPGNANSCATDPNAHALTLAIPLVSSSFSLIVKAIEFQADGLCPLGVTPGNDFDCRFVSFYNYGTDAKNNTITPLCYPYANGNCVHYEVSEPDGTEPDPSWYSGGVFWKIGFNNSSFTPASYWANSLPRLYDDPDDNEVPGLPYGTVCGTPMSVNGVPTSPAIYCQFDRDITTFWNPGSGLDPTIGGKTKQTNDVVVAFPPTSTGNLPAQQPPSNSAPTITGSCVSGCILNGNNTTFTVGTGGTFAITATGYPTPTLTELGTLPTGLTFNGTTGLISGTPTSAGTFPFTVTATNSVSFASHSYTLTVNALGVSTTMINFGTLYLGQFAARPITLTNTGTTPITISSVKITGPGNALGDYGNISLCTSLFSKLPGILPPGKSCPIFVGIWATAKIFSPTASTAMLSIIDNTAASPHLVQLTAQVINPKATLSTGSLAFPAQTVGTTSAPATVTLTNTGNTPLTLGTPTVSGDFALAKGTTCGNGGTIAAGGNCTIAVTFTPKAKGTRIGSMKITDNAQNSPQCVWLSGTGK